MAPKCVAPNCCNSNQTGHTLVRFPKELDRLQLWLRAIGRVGWTPRSVDRLCEIHFKPTDWVDRTSSKKLLSRSAVPSLLCHGEKCLTGCDVEFPAPGFVLISPSQNSHHHNQTCAAAISEDLRQANAEVTVPLTPLRRVVKLAKENINLSEKVNELSREVATKQRKIALCDRKILGLSQAANRREQWLEDKFGKDSLKVAESGNSRGVEWSINSVQKALDVKLSGGASCVKIVNDTICPLPSVRTVQRRTQPIRFNPGLLHEFLDPLKEIVLPTFSDEEKDVTLHFDDMSIKVQRCFDPGTGSWFGSVTLDGVEGLASKLEVYTFAGIQKKWKLNAAYHLTPGDGCVGPRAKVVMDLLQYAEESGLNCLAVVCDMGNRGLLTKLGFDTTKNNNKYCIPHPFNPEKELYLVPDVVHVFKAIKEMCINNEFVFLSEEIAAKYELPTTRIDFTYVELLVEFQEDNMDIRFAPRLKKKDLSKGHFSKMNVASACHIFHDKTAAAIDFLADENVFETECKTTAFFIKLVNKWFSILSSRCLVRALSLRNMEAYQEAISTLQLTMEVFSSLTVGDAWKPAQTHLIMGTESLIDISYHLLFELNYSFVFMGRFTNDISENIFSVIRSKRPTPTAVEAKYALKGQTLSQCSRQIVKSQYAHDDRRNLMSLEVILNHIEAKKAQVPVVPDCEPLPWTEPQDFSTIQLAKFKFKPEVLYRMSGYVIHSMRGSGQLNCDECFNNLQHQGETPLPVAKWTIKTDFIDGAQIRVCDEVYNLFQAIEFNLYVWEEDLLKAAGNLVALVQRSILPAIAAFNIPSCDSCPNLKKKISGRFIAMRIKQMEKAPPKVKTSAASDSSFSSKSMAYRALAANFKGKRKEESESRTRNNCKKKKLP